MGAMRKPRGPLTKIVDFEEMEVSLAALKVCPEMLQIRARTDMKVSQHYSKCRAKGSVFPPVLVYRVGEDLYLADGFHRYDAWKQLGFRTIPAVIRDGTIEDALLAGLEANGNDLNMRKLSDEDRSHAVRLMLRNEYFRMWPDKQIAKKCGVGPSMPRRIRTELDATGEIPLPDRVICFKGDVPTKRTLPYRVKMGTRPTINRVSNSQGKGWFQASIDGRPVGLGNDREAAEIHLDVALASKDQKCKFLADREVFARWLMRRGIIAESFDPAITPCGGYAIRDVAFEPVEEVTGDTFLLAAAKLIFNRDMIPGLTRAIIVGYIEKANTRVSRLLPSAARFSIECMSPEEFAAAFSPAGAEERHSIDRGLLPDAWLKILEALTSKGPLGISELEPLIPELKPSGIKAAISRLKVFGLVRGIGRGIWEVVNDDDRPSPALADLDDSEDREESVDA